MNRPKPKSKLLSARMTPPSLAQAVATAQRNGKTVSRWASDVLLNAITAPEPDLNARLIFSELAAQRASMMMLMQHAINGTKITEADLIAIVDECDQARFAMASLRLNDALKALAPTIKQGGSE